MKDFFTITIFTFFLVSDSFFLDYYFLVRACLLLFSIFLFLIANRKKQIWVVNKTFNYLFLFLLICALHFVYIFLYKYSPFFIYQINRSISLYLQAVIALLFPFALFSLYGVKSIKIAVYSFIIAYTICIFKGILYLGPVGLIEYSFDFSDAKVAAENYKLNKMFEFHSLGLTFPVFLLYNYIYREISKRNFFSKSVIFLLVFFTLLSLKRISIIAFFVVYLLYYFTKSDLTYRRIVRWAFPVISFVCFIILSIIYSPSFFSYIQDHGYNLMGREYLYHGITEETYLSVYFCGKGWGWAGAYMKFMNDVGNSFNGIMGVHNDILRLYTELGSVVFTLFLYIYYRKIPQKLNLESHRLSYYYILFQGFAFITYVTDNTFQYWDFTSVVLIAPFCLYYSIKQNISNCYAQS